MVPLGLCQCRFRMGYIGLYRAKSPNFLRIFYCRLRQYRLKPAQLLPIRPDYADWAHRRRVAATRLVLVGGVRNDADRSRLQKLAELAHELVGAPISVCRLPSI